MDMVLTDALKKTKTKNAGRILMLALVLASCSSLKKATETIKKHSESVSIYWGGSQGGFI